MAFHALRPGFGIVEYRFDLNERSLLLLLLTYACGQVP